MTCVRCGAPAVGQKGPRGQGRPRKYCDDHYGRAECAKRTCSEDAHTDGLCRTHYARQLAKQPKWTMRDELLDWLSLESTWATAEEAAERFGRHVDSVQRTLRELRREGVVESRTVELAGFHVRDRRTEWRLRA